ncbi:MAG: hypothetical protein ACLSH6_06580 [Limosilactobacillus pontis]
MTAVVMEAKTGKIIAATQRPTLRSRRIQFSAICWSRMPMNLDRR